MKTRNYLEDVVKNLQSNRKILNQLKQALKAENNIITKAIKATKFNRYLEAKIAETEESKAITKPKHLKALMKERFPTPFSRLQKNQVQQRKLLQFRASRSKPKSELKQTIANTTTLLPTRG